jgi:hypothetical protein
VSIWKLRITAPRRSAPCKSPPGLSKQSSTPRHWLWPPWLSCSSIKALSFAPLSHSISPFARMRRSHIRPIPSHGAIQPNVMGSAELGLTPNAKPRIHVATAATTLANGWCNFAAPWRRRLDTVILDGAQVAMFAYSDKRPAHARLQAMQYTATREDSSGTNAQSRHRPTSAHIR